MKVSKVLKGIEQGRGLVKKAGEGFSGWFDVSPWEQTDGIVDALAPFAKEMGVDALDMEVKRTTNIMASEKGEGDIDVIQTITTRDMDRDNEIVIPAGIDIDQFNKAPQVLLGHNHGELPVAVGPVSKRNNREMKASTIFAPTEKAQEAKELVMGGFLKTASIGFVPLQVADKGSPEFAKLADRFMKFPEFPKVRDVVRRFISKSLLLEWSFVSVPANINALTAAISKGDLEISDEWFKSWNYSVSSILKEMTIEAKAEEDAEVEVKKIEPVKRSIEITRVIEPVEEVKRCIEVISQPDIDTAVKNVIDVKYRGKV